MELSQKMLVLKESPVPDLKFSLLYSRNKPGAENRELSFQILSLLKQEQNVILEIDSSLFLIARPQESEVLIEAFIEDLRQLGIQFRRQTFQSNQTRGLSGLFGISKSTTVHQVFALIDNETWGNNEFKSRLPGNGLRYHICNGMVDVQKLFEDFSSGRLTEAEKKTSFIMNIYDCIEFGQMGIKTDLSKMELKELLGI